MFTPTSLPPRPRDKRYLSRARRCELSVNMSLINLCGLPPTGVWGGGCVWVCVGGGVWCSFCSLEVVTVMHEQPSVIWHCKGKALVLINGRYEAGRYFSLSRSRGNDAAVLHRLRSGRFNLPGRRAVKLWAALAPLKNCLIN